MSGRLPNPVFEFRTENWPASRAASPGVDVFAEFTQPLPLFSRRSSVRRLASAEGELAVAELTAIDRAIALEAARAYVHALTSRALLETLTDYRDGLALLVAGIDRRVGEGYTAEADLLKFKTEVARVDGDIARARFEQEHAMAALSVAIGAPAPLMASQLIDPGADLPPLPEVAAIATRITAHPDVVALDAAVARARLASAVERARRLPEPLITGGYKRTTGFDTMVLGLAVSVPLFDRNDAAVARAAATERAAAAEREALVYQLTSHAAASIRAAETITSRARQTPADLLRPAEAVRRAARAAFREGAADVLKLIDAERVYVDVQRAAIELRLAALIATIEARFALGEESIP